MKIFLIIVPIFFSILSLSAVCYLWIRNHSKQITINEDNDLDEFDIHHKLKIFSHINEYDFYSDVRVVDGKAIIDSNMVAKIINFVISNAQIPYGDIKYNYHQNNLQELNLTFLWVPHPNKRYLKISNPQQKSLLESAINLRNRGPLVNEKKNIRYSYFLQLSS